MSNIQRLWAAIRESGNSRYAPALARQQLLVVAVETDSNGAVTTARGTVEGQGDFSVPVRGEGVRVGMLIGVTQPAHDPAAPLTFDGIDATDDPTAGYFDIDPDLPAPTFSSPNNATAIIKSPGSVTARITVLFDAVTEKYKPSSYLVTWRLTAGPGEWQDVTVPHLGGAQECNLGSQFAPGSQVDVKLRTRYDWAHAYSVASAAVTITAASDNASPGTATTVAVDNSVAGQLVCTVTASTIDTGLFRQWRYEFSTSATGPFSDAIMTPGPAVFVGTPGAWYVRVAPVSKSGTVGTYTAWTGPTTLRPAAPALDITAPAAWSAPTVTLTRVTPDTGGESARLTVTLPAHTYESDYDKTIVRAVNGTLYLERVLQYNGAAHDPQVFPGLEFGTWQATLQAVDTSGNRSAISGMGSATLAAAGVPGAASPPTVTQVGMALKVAWTKPANAIQVELSRANDAGFTTGVVVLGTFDGTFFLDLAATDTSIVLPTYYYRIRGVNIGGNGTYSTVASGTVLALHGNWLVADSITAREIAAGTITATELNASIILASLVRTATTGTRWELEGHTGGGTQDQLRAYESVAGVDKLRMMLNGTGLYLYHDDASVAGKFYRDSGTGKTGMWLNGLRMYGAASGLGVSEVRLDIARMQFIGPNTTTWRFEEVQTVGGAYALGLMIPQSTSDYFVVGAEPASGTVKNGLVFYVSGTVPSIGWLDGSSATPDVTLARSGTAQITTGGTLIAAHLVGGASVAPFGYDSYLVQAVSGSTLGGNAGDGLGLTVVYAATGGGSSMMGRHYYYKAATNSYWYDARYRIDAYADNSTAGGGVDVGFKSNAAFVGLLAGGDTKLWWDAANTRITLPYGLLVSGTKSFGIPHPDPAKTDEFDLRHASVEAPTRGETLYRFRVTVGPRSAGKERTQALPDYFSFLNEDWQAWISSVRHFGRAWAEVDEDGKAVTYAADTPGDYSILVIATRADHDARATWDDLGGAVIPRAPHPDRGDDEDREHRRATVRGERRGPLHEERRRARRAPGTP